MIAGVMEHPARLALCSLLAILAGGCDAGSSDPGPEPPTIGEARALEQAAEMIDEGRPRSDVTDEGEAQADGSLPDSPAP